MRSGTVVAYAPQQKRHIIDVESCLCNLEAFDLDETGAAVIDAYAASLLTLDMWSTHSHECTICNQLVQSDQMAEFCFASVLNLRPIQ